MHLASQAGAGVRVNVRRSTERWWSHYWMPSVSWLHGPTLWTGSGASWSSCVQHPSKSVSCKPSLSFSSALRQLSQPLVIDGNCRVYYFYFFLVLNQALTRNMLFILPILSFLFSRRAAKIIKRIGIFESRLVTSSSVASSYTWPLSNWIVGSLNWDMLKA